MIITETPLRLSFLGGNTDFKKYYEKHGGAVLTTTIDKYVYCIVKERFDDEIRISYSIKEKVDRVEDIKHDLVREAMKITGVTKRIEIAFMSDIPGEGSGLGSSSAVTVGTLNALHQYMGETVGARQLAEEACEIEIDRLKKPIGVQDQYAVAFGGLNLIEFGKDITVHRLNISESVRTDLESSLMLFYTNRTRDASGVLAKMKLDHQILDETKKLAYSGKRLICDGNVSGLGELLDIQWGLKKKLNPYVTDAAIDEMYDKAIQAGATGGKILGAGGGGFMALIVPTTMHNAVREALNCRELPVRIAKDGSKVVFNIRQ